MPTLKQITCTIEWDPSKTSLEEYHTTYSDGYVETYLAVPELSAPFAVRLRSSGYIAPGLSMFVYIDGVYQCNRNRHNLRVGGKGTKKEGTEVDFRVRQKEDFGVDGLFTGKPWRFERVNVAPDSDINDEDRAPFNGEYVGMIEVVVLRCRPSPYSRRSFSPWETVVNRGTFPSKSSTRKKVIPTSADGARDLKAKPPRKGRSRAPQKSRRVSPFGLDGAWDDIAYDDPADKGEGTAKVDVWDWGELPAPTEVQSESSWGGFDEPPAPVKKQRSRKAASRVGSTSGSKAGSIIGPRPLSHAGESWGHWYNPSTISGDFDRKNSDPKGGSVSGSRAGSARVSQLGSKRKGHSDEMRTTREKTKAGNIEMTGATTGFWHPPTSSPIDKRTSKAQRGSEDKGEVKAGSRSGSRTGSQRDQSWGDWDNPLPAKDETPKRSSQSKPSTSIFTHMLNNTLGKKAPFKAGSQAGSHRSLSKKPSSESGQSSSRPLELRGGGGSSYSSRSRRGSAQAPPVFNVVFNNGDTTPRSLSMGPPPPRDWKAEARAEKAAAATAKREQKTIAEPVNDAWGDVTNSDGFNAEPDAQAKVDDWNAGGNDVPGAWDSSTKNNNQNDDAWGATNDNGQAENDAWGGNKGQNDGASNNAGESAGWGAQNDDNQENGAWSGAGQASDWDQPANDDAGLNDSNENNNDWGNNDDDEAQPEGNWNDNDDTNNQNDSDWNNVQESGGDDHQNNGWGNNDAGNQSAWGHSSTPKSKPGSVGKGSKTGSTGKAASVKSKGKSPPPQGTGSVKGSKKSASPKSKKGQSPKELNITKSTIKAGPILFTTAFSHAKAYWSNWNKPDGIDEEVIEEEPVGPAEEPIYTIPSSLITRTSTTHQVRPGLPITYAHKIFRPHYTDTHENPYAIFTFHYRSHSVISSLLPSPIIDPSTTDEKSRLASLPKDQLIQELLREKEKDKAKPTSIAGGSEKAASFKSNPHGIPLGPNISALKAKLSKLGGSNPATPDVVGAWVDLTSGNPKGGETGKKNKNRGKDSAWESNGWGDTNDDANNNTNELKPNEGNNGNGAWTGIFDEEKNDEDTTSANADNNDNNGAGSWADDAGGGGW